MEEIKQGYKQTDIGVIPEDWDVFNVRHLGRFSKGSGINRAESQTGEIPSIRYGEIYTTHNDYIKDFHSFISVSVSKNARKLKNGDLLFTASGETKEEIGKCVAFIDNIEAYAGGDILIISPENRFNSLLLGFLLNAPYVVKQKANKGQGDAVVHITKDALSDIVIALPKETSEQTAIATALGDVVALIAAMDKKITKKQQIKQGAMQLLLTGKKRLPGFSGEWIEKSLSEIAEIFRGGSPRPIENYLTNDVEGINWIKIGDVGVYAKYIDYTAEKIIPEGVARSRYVTKGDFLLSNSMSFGRPYILRIDGCIHDGWLVIKNYSKTFKIDYLYYILGYDTTLIQYKSLAAGSSVLNLNKEIVSKIILPCPSKSEQVAIAQILTDMDDEISQLEADRNKYEQIKAGMMQQLLTGKIRLNKN